MPRLSDQAGLFFEVLLAGPIAPPIAAFGSGYRSKPKSVAVTASKDHGSGCGLRGLFINPDNAATASGEFRR